MPAHPALQSTHSSRSATRFASRALEAEPLLQSTHSSRSATRTATPYHRPRMTSIHALLAECDNAAACEPRTFLTSIHALLAECDDVTIRHQPHIFLLQSTHSSRSATRRMKTYCATSSLQSTHSSRSATQLPPLSQVASTTSIHALLAECDRSRHEYIDQKGNFNPRTPRGVRRYVGPDDGLLGKLQSTHSSRSATRRRKELLRRPSTSIHALLAECDPCAANISPRGCHFNPRTPRGVRHGRDVTPLYASLLQSTHSSRSATGV